MAFPTSRYREGSQIDKSALSRRLHSRIAPQSYNSTLREHRAGTLVSDSRLNFVFVTSRDTVVKCEFSMGYRSLKECIADLDRTGQLVRIEQEIDPYLEAAEIQRRVNQAQGPAVFYKRVKGCRFPMVSNLFGTLERTRFLFRDTLAAVRHLIELKIEPAEFFPTSVAVSGCDQAVVVDASQIRFARTGSAERNNN